MRSEKFAKSRTGASAQRPFEFPGNLLSLVIACHELIRRFFLQTHLIWIVVFLVYRNVKLGLSVKLHISAKVHCYFVLTLLKIVKGLDFLIKQSRPE